MEHKKNMKTFNVVYFDQNSGAVHSKRWSKYVFWSKCKKTKKRNKNEAKQIFGLAPKSWTRILSPCVRSCALISKGIEVTLAHILKKMPDIEACMAVSTSGKLFENPKLKPEGLETGYDITRTKTSTSPGHSKMLNKKSEPILHPKTINGKKAKQFKENIRFGVGNVAWTVNFRKYVYFSNGWSCALKLEM